MKKNPTPKLALLFASLAAASATSGQSQVLFSENFDTDHSANWQVSLSGSDGFASVFFDYSTMGIPSAPNSTGGSTVGLRFLVNQSAGVQQGITASPIGQSFTGDYTLRFDMWLNYVGPLPAGGSGSTQIGTAGIGVNGTSAQWAGSSSGAMFGASTDAGTASAYRAYMNNAHQTATSVYAAGSQAAGTAYYTSRFGGQSAPAAQLSLYSEQTGSTPAGTVGFAWRDVEIAKIGTSLTYSIDGNLIATLNTTGATFSGNNIFFGLFDINNGSSTSPNDFLTFSLFDNIRVTAVPEPATVGLMAVGLGAVLLKGRRKQG